ncbi:MAG: hypothetical protein WCG10_06575 [Chlamydiota bacterium]
MSSPVVFRFPSIPVMTQFLCNHELLNTPDYQEMRLTQIVMNLAVERFADSDRVEHGILCGAALIVYDLQQGKDGFSGKKILGFDLPQKKWTKLYNDIERVLFECADLSTPVMQEK